MRKVLVILFSISFVIISSLLAHSGRTDKYGGHNDRKNGGYHFHNAGSVHNPNNPYQNHKTCGICSSSKQTPTQSSQDISEIDLIKTLQSGLVCLGYDVEVDGKLGEKTKMAVREHLRKLKE